MVPPNATATAYGILVLLALVFTLVHILTAPPRMPLWVPVLLICIALLIGVALPIR